MSRSQPAEIWWAGPAPPMDESAESESCEAESEQSVEPVSWVVRAGGVVGGAAAAALVAGRAEAAGCAAGGAKGGAVAGSVAAVGSGEVRAGAATRVQLLSCGFLNGDVSPADEGRVPLSPVCMTAAGRVGRCQ